MKLRKLNNLGSAHVILPLLAVIGAGIIGSFLLVQSHAQVPPSNGPQYSYSGGSYSYGSMVHNSGKYHTPSASNIYYSYTCAKATRSGNQYLPSTIALNGYDQSGGHILYVTDVNNSKTKSKSGSGKLRINYAMTYHFSDVSNGCKYSIQVYN